MSVRVEMKQLNHYDTLKKMPKLSIDCILYACGVSSENLGLILRTADIFGVNAVYYHQGGEAIDNKQILKLSRNSKIPVHFSSDLNSLLSLKDAGYRIVALEITSSSVPLRLGSFSSKTCLVVGNEKSGVSEDILEIADCSYHIEMIGGHISSLNVSIATSIALYEIEQFNLKNVSVVEYSAS